MFYQGRTLVSGEERITAGETEFVQSGGVGPYGGLLGGRLYKATSPGRDYPPSDENNGTGKPGTWSVERPSHLRCILTVLTSLSVMSIL